MKSNKGGIILVIIVVFVLMQLNNNPSQVSSNDTTYEIAGEKSARAAVTYTYKPTMINQFITLCNAHPGYCTYEYIGKTYQGKNIPLFKVGNPKGGALFFDGSMHGWEDTGTEMAYQFAKYILESTDPHAVRIKQNNYVLLMPIVNLDSYERANARRNITNGSTICCGVDINRNFCSGWGASGAGTDDISLPWPNNYRGEYCASENETQAVRKVFSQYKPKIYLNVHLGGGQNYYYCVNNAITQNIITQYNSIRAEKGITLVYPISQSCANAESHRDAYYTYGINAWMTETMVTPPDTLQEFIDVWWANNLPMYVAMAHAVEVVTTPVVGVCGDNYCVPGEEVSCPQDCAYNNRCGDGVCDNCHTHPEYHPGETCIFDTTLNLGTENHDNCPYDCSMEGDASSPDGSDRPLWLTYHTYDEIKTIMSGLESQYPTLVSHEIIGQTIQGKDIYLYRIGNPNGGRFMWDGRGHGMEDCGTETGLQFVKWVLSDSSIDAQNVRTKNYLLFIPVVNADSTRRQNMRRVNDNGQSVLMGVDLNRNGVYKWTSNDRNDITSYHGQFGGSEPETQAVRYAMQKYLRPDGYSVYMNTHCGMSDTWRWYENASNPTNTRILANMQRISTETGSNTMSLYPPSTWSTGGYLGSDGAYFTGGNGWMHETTEHTGLPPTLQGYLDKWYKEDFPIWLGMAQAVQIEPTTSTLTRAWSKTQVSPNEVITATYTASSSNYVTLIEPVPAGWTTDKPLSPDNKIRLTGEGAPITIQWTAPATVGSYSFTGSYSIFPSITYNNLDPITIEVTSTCQSQNTVADIDCDGCISDSEFPGSVTNWKLQRNGVTDILFPQIVTKWKNQDGCSAVTLKTACIGDSITRAGVTTNGGYCKLINSTYNTVNLGVNGYTVGNLTDHIDSFIGKGYTQSIIMIGTNNRGSNMVYFKSNLTYLINRLNNDGQKVILLTIPPAESGNWEPVNVAIKEVAQSTNTMLKDTCVTAFNNIYTSSYYVDGLHLNDAGHVILATAILNT